MNEVLKREKEMAREMMRQRELKLFEDRCKTGSKKIQSLLETVGRCIPEFVRDYVNYDAACEAISISDEVIAFVHLLIPDHRPIETKWLYVPDTNTWHWSPYVENQSEDLDGQFPYYVVADYVGNRRYTAGLGAAMVLAEVSAVTELAG